jgi:hypothetical protein
VTRYVLVLELPPGVVLDLSTRYPQGPEIVDISPKLSTLGIVQHTPAHSSESDDLGRSVGSGGARLRLRKATPETSLTEEELIAAHGGLRVVTDD